jgi:hypothetical protein
MSASSDQNPYSPGKANNASRLPTSGMPATIAAAAKTNQLISLAMVMGVTTITGILTYLCISRADKFADLITIKNDSILFLALGFGSTLTCAVLGYILRGQTLQSAINRFVDSSPPLSQPISIDEPFPGSQDLFAAYATANLLGAALLEGSAVLNAVLMLIGDNLLHLLPIALAIGGILITLPSVAKLKHYVEDAVSQLR